jgi:hypothetical protein
MDDSGTPVALSGKERYFKALFDAVPSAVFIVDDDVRILDYNDAAADVLGPDRSLRYLKRGGEALHCLHADEAPEGCGRGEHCRDCAVRNSVGEVFRGGKTVRVKTKMALREEEGDAASPVDVLVTAAPFPHEGKALVLLILDDVTELMRLREIVPICAQCKKVRSDRGYWESVDGYLRRHTSLDFSHGICPDCMERLYPGVLTPSGKDQPREDSPSRRNR